MQIGRRHVVAHSKRVSAPAVLAGALLAGVIAPRQADAQVFNYLSAPVDVTPGTTDSWEDVDVSAWVPAGATGVILQEVNPDPADRFEYGVRNNGSTDTWMNQNEQSRQDSLSFHIIGVDANRIFEVYTGSTVVRTYLLGYTMEGVTFFVNAVDKSISTTGSWTDIDISADTGADTAIGAVFVVKETERAGHDVALRMKGSSDDLYGGIDKGDAAAAIIGVDANEICQMKIDSTFVDLYLVGYVTDGAVFFTNAVDKATSTYGSYVAVDITGDIGADDANGAILALKSSGEEYFAVRPNGATHDYYQRIVEAQWPVIGIDANDIFEQKISATSHDLYLTGYTLATLPSPPTISSAADQGFFVGDALTANSQITITESATPVITAANDLRVRIPAGFNMLWNKSDLDATIGGTASGKVSTTVSYEDAGATLVLNVTSNFAAGETVTVSDVGFQDFTAASPSSNLELEVYNDNAVTSTDDKTIEIGGPNYRSIGTDSGVLYSTGTATINSGTSVVTFASATLPTDVGLGDKLTIGSPTSYSDDFEDGVITGWTNVGTDSLSESSGKLRQTSAPDDSHYIVDEGSAWTDYTVTCDIMAKDNDDQGISFRVQDGSNFYVLRQRFGNAGPDRWNLTLEKHVGGSSPDIVTLDNEGSAPGQVDSEDVWYTLKVELSGTSIKCYVDNVLKIDTTDSTFSDGTVGVWCESHAGDWDNMTVTGSGGGGEYHILSRDSDTQATVQETAASTFTDESYTIERAYNTMQAWEDARQGDLVAQGLREVGVCYNDGPFTDRLVISGSTTDAAHYMKLTVAEGHRHDGVKNGGACIDAGGGWTDQNAIDVEDEYTRIEWLEIKKIYDAGDAISFANTPSAANGLAYGIYVHGFWQNNNSAVRVDTTDVTVRNCFITGGTSFAVRVEASANATIENCTLWGYSGGGYGVYTAAGDVAVRNTISVDHGTLDFYIETGGTATISYFGNNMFSTYGGGFVPSSYQGGNQIPPANLEYLFGSISNPEDLHLETSGHRAGNTGLDLSSSFSDDIDGATRSGVWDMGADEAVSGTEPLTPKILVWQEIDPATP